MKMNINLSIIARFALLVVASLLMFYAPSVNAHGISGASHHSHIGLCNPSFFDSRCNPLPHVGGFGAYGRDPRATFSRPAYVYGAGRGVGIIAPVGVGVLAPNSGYMNQQRSTRWINWGVSANIAGYNRHTGAGIGGHVSGGRIDTK